MVKPGLGGLVVLEHELELLHVVIQDFFWIEEKYRCVRTLSRQGASVEQVCREVEVSRSGYYGWLKHKLSERSRRNQALRRRLVELHENTPLWGGTACTTF